MRDKESMEAIAIVGMGCRFHGANNADEFWHMLENGIESIEPLSDEMLLAAGVDPATIKDPKYVKAAGCIDGIDMFDASFFGLNPMEAEILDPQQRLFLECCWEALENAACVPDSYPGRIGVYAGIGANHYLVNNIRTNPDVRRSAGQMSVATANEKDYVATRVSYTFNLRGPSITVQTACSTSLVAICLASQSLLTYQSDMTLAGGVFLRLRKVGYRYQEGNIMSPDGHCRAFDAQAQGTLFSSGAGVVVLKRLSEAIADGDHIDAVIKGFAINNDGSAKVGFTAPGVDGQAEVVGEALAMAGLSPEAIGYVEAHGTGTQIGDPIEIAALTKAYRAQTRKTGFCAVGSVKTNLGHTNSAAGVAGFIKATLAVDHGIVPPNLHFQQPNPAIDFANSPFFVNNTPLPWHDNGGPRRAAVSSFGIGGTNAHVILEEAPQPETATADRPYHLLVLSAMTDASLEAATDRLGAHLTDHAASMADVAYSLQVGRKVFDHRRVLVCRDREDAAAALRARDPRRLFTVASDSAGSPVVFMFSGQGSQYVNMGVEVYRNESAFRRHLDRCADILKPLVGLDLRELLYPASSDGADEAARLLGQTFITQPALFAIEYAMANLWMEWGVHPAAMIGHSIGEYVAACLAGVFSLEDALALVAERGRLMQQMPAGAMVAVPLAAGKVEPLMNAALSLASVNAPSLSVVSGPIEAIDAFETVLQKTGASGRRLHTSHAFHSSMMEPMLDRFTAAVSRVACNPPQIPFISNVTGSWISAAQAADPEYWARHLRSAVQFSAGVQEVMKDPARLFLEVGPGRTLQTLVKQHPEAADRTVAASLPHPGDRETDLPFVLNTLGELWMAGVHVRWDGLYPSDAPPRRIALPTYPFDRQRFWIEPGQGQPDASPAPPSAAKTPDIGDWFYFPSWRRSTGPELLAPPDASAQAISSLVFDDGSGVGASLSAALEARGQNVIAVTAGARFARVEDKRYTIDPQKAEDYDLLLKALPASKGPLRIVYAWPLTSDGAVEDTCFFGLVSLAQALGRSKVSDSITLVVIGRGIFEITGNEELVPETSLVLGPCRTIPQEYPHVECRYIDIETPSSPERRNQLIAALVEECGRKSTATAVAYRAGHRWVQVFEPVRVTEAAKENLPLREQGVYLITGGMGGIGLTLAEHLAVSVRARLALVGRSLFPPREEWEVWVSTHDEADAVSAVIRKLQACETAGAEVLVLRADVADEDQMREAVDRVIGRWGVVHGVLHAAGVPAGGLIQLKTRASAEEVLAPKVRGTLILDRLFANADLDCFVVFSSIAAILGAVGQVDYCAANAFLDAFAQNAARRNGRQTVSINWDVWEEVGMAVKARERWPSALGVPAGGTEATDTSGFEKIDHLLLDRFVSDDESDTYTTDFSPSTHWVLNEHRLLGRPTLVGTSYLEMARAAYARHAGSKHIELRNVVFLAPLVVPEGDRKQVRTVVQRNTGSHEFTIRSAAPSENGGEPAWHDHAVGNVAAIDPGAEKVHSITDILSRCTARHINRLHKLHKEDAQTGSDGAARPMSFGSRWTGLRYELHLGSAEALAEIELPEQLSGDLANCQLHPALLDVAISFTASRAASEEGDAGFFLPFSYAKVQVKGPLTRRIFSHVRRRDAASGDFIAVDAVIMDERGAELVVVENFTMKKVSQGAIQALSKRQQPSEKPAVPVRKADTNAQGITPAEGVEAFLRVMASSRHLPQLIVSTRDLQGRLARSRATTQAELVQKLEKKMQKARPKHPRPSLKIAYVAPGNELEQAIADIWRTVLGIENVGVHDGFLELGGNSLLGVQIVSRVRDTFQMDLPLEAFFKAPTIAELAEAIAARLIAEADSATLNAMLDEIEHTGDGRSQRADAAGTHALGVMRT